MSTEPNNLLSEFISDPIPLAPEDSLSHQTDTNYQHTPSPSVIDPISQPAKKPETKLAGFEPSSQIHTFESDSKLSSTGNSEFKRPLLKDSNRATRLKTFHTRLSDNAMSYLQEKINEWIDADPEIEVKFSTTVVGEVEGKKTEQHLIITVWY